MNLIQVITNIDKTWGKITSEEKYTYLARMHPTSVTLRNCLAEEKLMANLFGNIQQLWTYLKVKTASNCGEKLEKKIQIKIFF